MGLNYPPFPSNEYAFLNQTLCIVDYLLDLQAVDREIASLTHFLEGAKKTAKTQGKGLQKAITDEVKAYEDFSRPDGQRAIETFRGAFTGEQNIINRDRREQAVLRIYQAYSKFDAKKFEEDFKTLYAHEIAQSAEQRKEVQSLVGKLTYQQNRRAEIIKEASTAIYRDGCPHRAFDFRVTDDFNEEAMTEVIMARFFRDWSDRVKKFDVPVSITGIAIHTMSPARRTIWTTAFTRLGLNTLKRARLYQWYVAPAEMEVFTAPTVLRGENNG